MATGERVRETVRPTRIGRASSLVRPAAALLSTTLGAAAVFVLFLLATVFLLAVALFGVGCAFTQKVVKTTVLSSPEMRFDGLDPHRDLPGSEGIGGGGGGGC